MADQKRVVRQRDAERTRADLLEAAADLFGQHGYAATTLRAIGERAGADPALIARYFGNKEALYLEAITHAPLPDKAEEALGTAALTRMMDLARESGPTPVGRIALVGTDDELVQSQVSQVLHDRSIIRLMDRLGVDEHEVDHETALRIEIALAVALGVAGARSSGVLTTLASAPTDEVVELCAAAIEAVLSP